MIKRKELKLIKISAVIEFVIGKVQETIQNMVNDCKIDCYFTYL